MTVGIQRLMSDIEAIKDRFHEAVYSTRDLDAAMSALTPECVLTILPSGGGATGVDALRDYLAATVLPHLPADLSFRRVSRTVDTRRVVDEHMVEFTHDLELPWLLPSVPPTHRLVRALAISVVTFRHTSRLGRVDSRITSHRTLWDHAALTGGRAAATGAGS